MSECRAYVRAAGVAEVVGAAEVALEAALAARPVRVVGAAQAARARRLAVRLVRLRALLAAARRRVSVAEHRARGALPVVRRVAHEVRLASLTLTTLLCENRTLVYSNVRSIQ